jgi:hypothetical protein
MSATSSTGKGNCRQCGAPISGAYCSNCGTKVEEEGDLGEQLSSKLNEPTTTGLALVKTAWLVLFAPTRFFASYFNASEPLDTLSFPLTPLWRRLSDNPQHVLTPFKCLGIGLALAAFCDVVDGWINDLAPPLVNTDTNSPGFRQWFTEQYGHAPVFIDLSHLTGYTVIDEPVHQIVSVLYYSFAAVLIGSLLVGTPVQRRQYLSYHAYAVGTALTLKAAAFLVAFVLAVLLAGVSRTATRAVVDLEELLFGFLPFLWFIAVLPVRVFPRILPVRRGRMIVATAGGLALNAAFNVWFVWVQPDGWVITW